MEYIVFLFIISIFLAIGIVSESIDKDNIWEFLSFFYLGCCFSFYFYSNERYKEDARSEIAELNREIKVLEHHLESTEETIDFYKKELEKLQDNSQQELH